MTVSESESAGGETSVLEPPKLYLDTCHLIRIARMRKGEHIDNEEAYQVIDDCIRERHFGLIFNPFSVLEWVDGDATLDSAREIAGIADSAKLQYEIEADTFVYVYEVLNEIRRIRPDVRLPTFEVFFIRDPEDSVERAMSVLRLEVESFFEAEEIDVDSLPPYTEIPFGTVREHVDVAWEFRQKKPDVYQERVTGYRTAFFEQLASFQQTKNGRPDYVGWMKRFLKVDRILSELNDDLNVDQVLGAVDLEKCPAAHLFLNARHKRVQAGNAPHDNDVDDWQYIPAILYADLVLTERNLQAFLLQADSKLSDKVTHDPERGLEILQKWL